MNILIVSEKQKIYEEYIDKLILETSQILDYKIKVLTQKKSRTKIDINMILSDDIAYIENEFSKIKEKNNVLIITNNFDPKHVIACLLLTNNVFSLRKGEKYILEKIIKIYNLNKTNLKECVNVS